MLCENEEIIFNMKKSINKTDIRKIFMFEITRLIFALEIASSY